MRTSLLLAALVVAAAAPASAQVRFLPYVGYNMSAGADFEESFASGETEQTGGFLVGVGAEFGFTPGVLPLALKLRPSVETVFIPTENIVDILGGIGGNARSASPTAPTEVGDVTQRLFQANLDLVAEFSPPAAPVAVYAGVGGAFVSYSAELEGGDPGEDEVDDSAFGANVFAGLRLGGGFIAPFVQARYTMVTIQPGADDLPDGEEFPEDDELHGGLSILAGVSIGL